VCCGTSCSTWQRWHRLRRLPSRLLAGLPSRCAAASTTRVERSPAASIRSGQRQGFPLRLRQVRVNFVEPGSSLRRAGKGPPPPALQGDGDQVALVTASMGGARPAAERCYLKRRGGCISLQRQAQRWPRRHTTIRCKTLGRIACASLKLRLAWFSSTRAAAIVLRPFPSVFAGRGGGSEERDPRKLHCAQGSRQPATYRSGCGMSPHSTAGC
jgi:hypothetical protein